MSYTVNNDQYISNIMDMLTFFVSRVESENKANSQRLNILAEGFYGEFLNLLMGWNLTNANIEQANAPGIDLFYESDEAGNIIVQVSSTYTHKKIQESLDKAKKSRHPNGHFYFVAITTATQNYDSFIIPEGITFDKDKDILSTSRIETILSDPIVGIKKLKALSELVDLYFKRIDLSEKTPYLTNPPPFADTNSVICREEELGEIEAKLKRGENVLLMSGFGGIGKTALARLVFHTVKKNYDQVAWVPYRNNLKGSMLSSILGLQGAKPEERWLEIQRILNNGASKLIVIDNADQDDSANQLPHKDHDLIALTGIENTTVIVTSRKNKLPSFTTYPVGFMDEEKCLSLFYCYYDSPQRAEDEPVVRNLIQMAGCHTFTVELLAKGANCEDSLEEYYQDLKKEGFSFPEIKVDTAHNDATTTIAGHLKILFNRKTRTDIQMELLYDFSVLPAAATLNKKEIKAWFGIDVNPCEQLVKDGWLLREGGCYAMHPLVKEILHLDPIPEHTAEKFLAFVEDEDNGYFSYNDVHTARKRKLALAESVVESVCCKDTLQLAHIHHNMGTAYRRAVQYPQAETHSLRAIAIKEAKLGKDHPDTAATYNNIAGVYQDMRKLDDALTFHEKAKKIREAKLGKDHPDTAATYNNIALVYKAKGDLDKALKFFEKVKDFREAKLGKDHPDTAATYNNIAKVYHDMGDLDEALKFFEKVKDFREAKLGKDHPDTAGIYNNIAIVYHDMGDLDKAQKFFEKDMAICEARLGKDHLNTAFTYYNMGILYYAKEDYQTATDFHLRELRIFLRVFPQKFEPGHYYVEWAIDRLFNCHIAEGNVRETFFPWLMGQLDEESQKILSAHL